MGQRGSLRRDFLVDNLDLVLASGVEDASWEQFQLDLFEDDDLLRCEVKSRQIAWSFSLSADFLADALLFGVDGVFVSINLEEASEKIRYAKTIYDCLDLKNLPSMERSNSLSLEFSNGARLTSLPAKPPRGRARANVGLDEFAHSPKDREILKGAMPIVSKGGRLRMGSSPLGNRGVFWDVATQTTQPYPGYTRTNVPWWHIQAFCKDVGLSKVYAPSMSTEQRVRRFGKERLQRIFENILLEDFQQEYECDFGSGDDAWISLDEIMAVVDPELPWAKGESFGGSLDGLNVALSKLKMLIQTGKVKKNLYLGYDIGRRRDLSQIVILEKTGRSSVTLRALFTLRKMPFPAQEEFLHRIWKELSIRKGKIDQTGIGMQLAETAVKKLPGASGEDFTNAKKTDWARIVKLSIQNREIVLPSDRDVSRQLTSLKRNVTSSGNFIFDVERSEKHHADIFWALGLGLDAASSGLFSGLPSTNGVSSSSVVVPSRKILVPAQVSTRFGFGGSFLESIQRRA